MPELGLHDDSLAAAFATPARRYAVVTALLLPVLAIGCGKDDAEQRKAYDDAQVVVERERATLAGMQAEYDRLYGEYLMHEFESRVWSGRVSLGKPLGLDVDREVSRTWPLSRFFYQKWPLGWFGRIDRLLTTQSELMPWYNRYQGEAYNRKLTDHYRRLLADLNDRLAIQRDRVRNAEEYARITGPPDEKK
jgi:hypothetical protein